MNMTGSEITRELKTAVLKIAKINQDAKELIQGREMKILSDYNGQPYGSSKPSLKGKIFRVESVSIEGDGCQLLPKGMYVYLPIEEVEIL